MARKKKKAMRKDACAWLVVALFEGDSDASRPRASTAQAAKVPSKKAMLSDLRYTTHDLCLS